MPSFIVAIIITDILYYYIILYILWYSTRYLINILSCHIKSPPIFTINLSLFCCRHENISGFYRVSSFFLAKLFCDVLPNRSVPILAFGIISYWMIGRVAKKLINLNLKSASFSICLVFQLVFLSFLELCYIFEKRHSNYIISMKS